MKPRLHPTPTLFVSAVILAIVVRFPPICCQATSRYDACGESVECGNDQLGYPFWGSGRPAYCGHSGFQLTCQSGVFLLNYESVDYRVLRMVTSTQVITIARNDLYTDSCPRYLHNTTYNSTLFNDDNFGQENVSLYYGCNSNLTTVPLPSARYIFDCVVNNTQTESYFYRTSLIENNLVNFSQCNNHITVPVNQTWATQLGLPTATMNQLRSALTSGFNLRWTVYKDECDRCMRSEGRCGSNSTSMESFACYCASGEFSQTCNNSNEEGIARGLEYLHQGCNTRIVHFDIKPHNILLNEEFVPKISDFGLAKLCKRKESILSVMGARGTAGYMAPEVFFKSLGGASHKSDVYSYGMMVLEITGARRNSNASASEEYFPDWIYKQVEAGDNLGINRVTSEEEEELARKMVTVSLWCIQSDPSDRPSISKVVEMLEGTTTIRFSAILCRELQLFDVCGPPLHCGDLMLGYPFWGLGRPAYCGHPGFQLVTCQFDQYELNDYFILTYESVDYRVLATDTDRKIITIVRDDLSRSTDICPQYLHNTSYNSTLFDDSYVSNQNVSLYYGCKPSNLLDNRFTCHVNGTNNYGYFNRTSDIDYDRLEPECKSHIIVLMKSNDAEILLTNNATQHDLTRLLRAGFDLHWKANNDECDQCSWSGGWCGSNQTRPELFSCYCYTGNFSLTCNNTYLNEVAYIGAVQKLNMKWKLATGLCSIAGIMFLSFVILCWRKRSFPFELHASTPNGSLDKFLRDDDSRLDWNTLFLIAKGIARGLEYLHRGCNTRIVHFDIKPHNILLDADFVPKISDFGLAKLCKWKESIVSVMGARGTAGYMAPEVFLKSLGGASHKSDVYSYGMMVLEMTGARENNKACPTSRSEAYFPEWIHKKVEAGDTLGVYGDDEDELARKMVIVSLWCIQSGPSDRPSISKVVDMLEGNLESLQVPPSRFWPSPTRPAQNTSSLATQSSTDLRLSIVQSAGEEFSS
ncbi:Protein kinase, catalytic domain-containing protein [Cynara cardunculus var. scolymus]|uniref:non-specific serine/threonine protein kinase n=1 Tax=Cynara cardunculus var. scolymus TaxID=59895 RepID=A0A103Y090_CYNCS|nr:Protein kinase, catalytic domain-containing protein [Cynara cardunculus var. scolymus]